MQHAVLSPERESGVVRHQTNVDASGIVSLSRGGVTQAYLPLVWALNLVGKLFSIDYHQNLRGAKDRLARTEFIAAARRRPDRSVPDPRRAVPRSSGSAGEGRARRARGTRRGRR